MDGLRQISAATQPVTTDHLSRVIITLDRFWYIYANQDKTSVRKKSFERNFKCHRNQLPQILNINLSPEREANPYSYGYSNEKPEIQSLCSQCSGRKELTSLLFHPLPPILCLNSKNLCIVHQSSDQGSRRVHLMLSQKVRRELGYSTGPQCTRHIRSALFTESNCQGLEAMSQKTTCYVDEDKINAVNVRTG